VLTHVEALRDSDEAIACRSDLVDDCGQRVAIEGAAIGRMRADVHQYDLAGLQIREYPLSD